MFIDKSTVLTTSIIAVVTAVVLLYLGVRLGYTWLPSDAKSDSVETTTEAGSQKSYVETPTEATNRTSELYGLYSVKLDSNEIEYYLVFKVVGQGKDDLYKIMVSESIYNLTGYPTEGGFKLISTKSHPVLSIEYIGNYYAVSEYTKEVEGTIIEAFFGSTEN